MTRKILWMFLSFLLVAALVLASCAKEEVVVEEEEEEEEVVEEEEEEEEEEVVEPAVGVPQRGGTVTTVMYGNVSSAGIPDPANLTWPGAVFTHGVLEHFRKADYERYGVRGTGEFTFWHHKQSPFKYFRGALAESWEVTADKIVFHIRPGVYWAADLRAHVMESREYTAHDFVFNVNRLLDPENVPLDPIREVDFIESVTATDKYTVVIETKFFYPEWWAMISGYSGAHIPPEVVEAGPEDWDNIVGTGPFMVKEHDPGVSVTYERNPNYWDTTTINGIEYEVPFIDEVVRPLIPDISTVIAALRTGVIDVYWYTYEEDRAHLVQTTPELLCTRSGRCWTAVIILNTERPPLDDVNVRRALMIGTDREPVHKATLAAGPLYNFPLSSGVPGHVPLEELPPDVRELFDYDPVKARQMLRDAGVPEGFELELHAVSVATHPREEIAPMVASMWERDLGIKTIFKPVEAVAWQPLLVEEFPADYAGRHIPDVLLPFTLFHSAFDTKSIGTKNFARYSNPVFDELLAKAERTFDDAEREAMLEELFIMGLRDVPYIPIGGVYFNTMWWPWLKNFYGEPGAIAWGSPVDTLWIDQDLKAEMGYK